MSKIQRTNKETKKAPALSPKEKKQAKAAKKKGGSATPFPNKG